MLLASSSRAQETLPADQLISSYVNALGGAAKLRAITTRVMQGTMENSDDGSTSQAEIRAKAPNRYALVVNLPDNGGALRTIFAGDAGWNQDSDGAVRAMSRSDIEAARRDYDFYRDLRLSELYPKMAVPRKARLGSADAWVVEAQPAGGEPEKLWFDATTNLLISREYQRTSLEDGIILYQEYYEDYRDVDGVKVPWKIRRATPDYELAFRFTSVRLNAAVDDATFAKPSK
jgi:hypothetical protein